MTDALDDRTRCGLTAVVIAILLLGVFHSVSPVPSNEVRHAS